jgi:hypothetical protein
MSPTSINRTGQVAQQDLDWTEKKLPEVVLDEDGISALHLKITLPRLGASRRFGGPPSGVHHLKWMGLCPTEARPRHSQRERLFEGPSRLSLEVGLTPDQYSCCRDGARTSVLDCVFPQAGSQDGVRRPLTTGPSRRTSCSGTSLMYIERLTPSRGWIRC